MGRVLFVLDLKLSRFLYVVVLPGFSCYLVAGLLAWPAAQLVSMVNRWQGAGILAVVGVLYAAGTAAVLYRWVLTNEEKQKANRLANKGMQLFRAREAHA